MADDRPLSLADVHEGRDGWLFLTGGRNRPLAFYGGSLRRAWLLRRWERLVRARARRAAALGIGFTHLVVPEKLGVYPEMTRLSFDPDGGMARALAARVGVPALSPDLLADLRAAKGGERLYARADTHWTSAGCFAALERVARVFGVRPHWTLADRPTREVEFPGDLGLRFTPARLERQVRVEVLRDGRRVDAHPLTRRFEESGRGDRLHRGACVTYRNEAPEADPRRLLVFGDSYAHFIDYQLTGMLAETFREVHFVWSASIDWRLVARLRPDLLVTEMAERFMARVPRDDFDLPAFAAGRLAALEAELAADARGEG